MQNAPHNTKPHAVALGRGYRESAIFLNNKPYTAVAHRRGYREAAHLILFLLEVVLCAVLDPRLILSKIEKKKKKKLSEEFHIYDRLYFKGP